VFLGKTEALSAIYKDLDSTGYLPNAALADFWRRTREKHVRVLKMDYDSYKCGIFAIDRIAARVLGTTNYSQSALLRTRATTNGFSLFQLQGIASGIGLSLVPVHRESGADLVVPSVLHWKYDHYSAIVQERDGLYYVVDPSSGPPVWVSADEINAEASGYFLIPVAQVQAPFTAMDSVAASQIIGKPSSCPPEDWNDDECPGSGSNPDCPTCTPGGGSNGGSTGGKKHGKGVAVGGASSNDAVSRSNQDYSGMSDWDAAAGQACTVCGGMPVWRVS